MITVRDGNGDVAYTGPVIFLPEDQTFPSFGVVKAPDARPADRAGGAVLPDVPHTSTATRPRSSATTATRAISMLAYVGDLGMDGGDPQSVYVLDKDDSKQLAKPDGSMFRVDLCRARPSSCPTGLGSVTLDGVDPWVQASRSAVRLARAWRSRASCSRCSGCSARSSSGRGGSGCGPGVRTRRGVTLVEVAGLDRSGGGDVSAELAQIVTALTGGTTEEEKP